MTSKYGWYNYKKEERKTKLHMNRKDAYTFVNNAYQLFINLMQSMKKKGYFDYTYGQWFLFSSKIENYGEYHWDKFLYRLICDKCIDGHICDNKERKCQLKIEKIIQKFVKEN